MPLVFLPLSIEQQIAMLKCVFCSLAFSVLDNHLQELSAWDVPVGISKCVTAQSELVEGSESCWRKADLHPVNGQEGTSIFLAYQGFYIYKNNIYKMHIIGICRPRAFSCLTLRSNKQLCSKRATVLVTFLHTWIFIYCLFLFITGLLFSYVYEQCHRIFFFCKFEIKR